MFWSDSDAPSGFEKSIDAAKIFNEKIKLWTSINRTNKMEQKKKQTEFQIAENSGGRPSMSFVEIIISLN